MTQFSDTEFPEILRGAFLEHDENAREKTEEAANVRRVEDMFKLIVRGAFDEVGDMLTDDVEFEIVGPTEAYLTGRHRGRAEVIESVHDNFKLVEEQYPIVDSVIAQGEQVVIVSTERGRATTTGRPYHMTVVHVFTFRNGLIARLLEVFDTAAWMAASGKRRP